MATTQLPITIDHSMVAGDALNLEIPVLDANGQPATFSGPLAGRVRPTGGRGQNIDVTVTAQAHVVTISATEAQTAQFGLLNSIQIEIRDGTEPHTIGDGVIRAARNLV